MRQVVFYGIVYEVPEWARFISQNKEGTITVHEECPDFRSDGLSKGRMLNILPLRYPVNLGVILDKDHRCLQLSDIPNELQT